MRALVLTLVLLLAPSARAAPLLVVDAVPDPDAPWLADAPRRYGAWLERHQVGVFLQLVAPVFATKLEDSRPLRVHLVALRAGDHLRARTLADDLAVQIRAEDSPDRRADVIVHEAVHALQQRGGVTASLTRLPPDARELLDEALATAIGQGLWRWLDHALGEALGEIAWRQGRDRFAEDIARPWYVADRKGERIDAWARALEPLVAQAVGCGTRIDQAADALGQTWRQVAHHAPAEGK